VGRPAKTPGPGGAADKRLAAVVITAKGLRLAGRLRKGFPSIEVFGPGALKKDGLFKTVKRCFNACDGLLFISAAGIAVRAIAPLLKGKHLDPPVVVMDEGGRFVVSLVSGHLGGANSLAEEIAALIKATPVVTTATDVAGLPCVEDLAKEFSLAIEEIKRIKAVNSAILAGGPVVVVDGNRKRLKSIRGFLGPNNKAKKGFFVFRNILKPHPGAKAYVVISNELTPRVSKRYADKTMLLRPKEFVAGVGCRKGVGALSIGQAVKEAFIGAGLSPLSLCGLATIDIKRNEPGITRFADKAGVGVEYFTARELNTVRPPSGPSAAAKKATGAVGVSEPAALLSTGAKRLWVRKIKKKNVTVALARAPYTS
jgi:cobalt-precorrin 5A hydrolase